MNRLELGEITHHNIRQLKCLNQVIFPVEYTDSYYKSVLSSGRLAKYAYFNDIVVGSVCCRVDVVDGVKKLYIMTLGCLAPYRCLGIGSRLLQHVMECVDNLGDVTAVYLHVHVSNTVAISFYEKHGFNIVFTQPAYYKKLEPSDAHVLEKSISASKRHNNISNHQPNI